MVFAAYLLENTILVLSRSGAFAPYFWTPPWDFCMNARPQRQGLLCVIRSLTHPDFGCVKRFAEWFCVRLSFLFSPSPPPPSRISSTLAPLIGRPDTQARVKASVSGVSLLQLSPFSLSSFTFSPETTDTQATPWSICSPVSKIKWQGG